MGSVLGKYKELFGNGDNLPDYDIKFGGLSLGGIMDKYKIVDQLSLGGFKYNKYVPVEST